MRPVNGTKQLFYFGRGTGGQSMVTVFYLNNSKVDRDMLEAITLDQVAIVKFVPMLGSENGFPPALAVFLKKPGDEGYWEKDRISFRGIFRNLITAKQKQKWKRIPVNH